MKKDGYIKLGPLKGKVGYGYLRATLDEEIKNPDELDYAIHVEPFCSLGDMLSLTSDDYLEKIREELLADRIWVDSISFNSLSIDEDMDVELILMKDEFFGQVIKNPKDDESEEWNE